MSKLLFVFGFLSLSTVSFAENFELSEYGDYEVQEYGSYPEEEELDGEFLENLEMSCKGKKNGDSCITTGGFAGVCNHSKCFAI